VTTGVVAILSDLIIPLVVKNRRDAQTAAQTTSSITIIDRND